MLLSWREWGKYEIISRLKVILAPQLSQLAVNGLSQYEAKIPFVIYAAMSKRMTARKAFQ